MKVVCPKCGWTRKGPGSSRDLVTRLNRHLRRSEDRQCGRIRQFLKMIEPGQAQIFRDVLEVNPAGETYQRILAMEIAAAFAVSEHNLVKEVFYGQSNESGI